MSRSPDRRSTLERGSPETEPRSCGTQPAHESLFNRRLRVLSPAVRTTIGAVRSGGVKNCALPLESEHEKAVELGVASRAVFPLMASLGRIGWVRISLICRFLADYRCLYRKLDSTITVMKATHDRLRCDAAYVLDGTMDRSV